MAIVNEKFIHFSFEYKNGLNIDTLEFQPKSSCIGSGLYFTELNNLPKWFIMGNYICKVIIPNDAYVYIEINKFKADKIILDLDNKVSIRDFYAWKNFNFCISAIKANGNFLQFIKNQTEELCLLAIQNKGESLYFIKEQTEEICLLSIKQNGRNLQFANKQTEELCKLAVQENCYALEFVKDQTEEICKLAIQENGYALEFVKNQTEEICLLAVKQNSIIFKFVKIKTDNLYKLVALLNSSVN